MDRLEGYISNLADELAKNPEAYNTPVEPNVKDVTWQYALPVGMGLTRFGLNPLKISEVYGAVNNVIPFLPDFWQGRGLIFRKPYDWMSKDERNAYADKGIEYYQNHLVNHPVDSILGDIDFHGNRAAETNPRYMNQYPFVRYNLHRAQQNTPVPNYKYDVRNNTDRFNNLDVNMFGKDYVYQVRHNKNYDTNDFYNIREKEAFLNDIETKLKQNPELYQQFLDMQK